MSSRSFLSSKITLKWYQTCPTGRRPKIIFKDCKHFFTISSIAKHIRAGRNISIHIDIAQNFSPSLKKSNPTLASVTTFLINSAIDMVWEIRSVGTFFWNLNQQLFLAEIDCALSSSQPSQVQGFLLRTLEGKFFGHGR